jgi:glycosyltransferase involved in cell wall biosynthesis
MAAPQTIFIVTPDGQVGGGMGRVKDYILEAGQDSGGYEVKAISTRDHRGFVVSLGLTARALLTILRTRLRGDLALVHVNFGDKASAARKGIIVLICRAIGVPTLLHLHAVELERHYAAGGAFRRWAIRKPFETATAIAVLGDRWRDWLATNLGIDRAKIDVLYNGVSVDPTAATVERSKDQLLFLGNLIERKGVTDLLEALATLPKGTPWSAVFAGGGDADHYRGVAERLSIGARVTFAGWLPQAETRRRLAAAAMLVLPSYEEGLPLAILEALGMGTPVICTPVGSIAEVMRDRATALFVEPGNVGQLGARIGELLGDPALRRSLSDNGLALFERQFSLRSFQRSLFALYERRYGIRYVPSHFQASVA